MDLAPLSFAIRLQIDLCGIETVEAIFNHVFQSVAVTFLQTIKLRRVQNLRDLRAEGLAFLIGFKGRREFPCPFVGEDTVAYRDIASVDRARRKRRLASCCVRPNAPLQPQ